MCYFYYSNSRVELIKNWIGRHKKFVIIGSVLFALLVAVVCGVTFSLSRIYGSAYDVDNIGNNIDKIKVGDSISYTANGYSDWKVLSIDKENHTIDIISKGSVGDLTINYSDREKFSDILQEEANKYLDGKYAINARSISDSKDELGGIETDGYWINRQGRQSLYHSRGEIWYPDYDYENISGSFLPLVTLNVGDSSALNVGDVYNYSLNGVNEWRILYKNDLASISIVPTSVVEFSVKRNTLPNFLESVVGKFKADNVITVRSVTSSDQEAMNAIGIGYNCFYTGEVELEQNLSGEVYNNYYVNRDYKIFKKNGDEYTPVLIKQMNKDGTLSEKDIIANLFYAYSPI